MGEASWSRPRWRGRRSLEGDCLVSQVPAEHGEAQPGGGGEHAHSPYRPLSLPPTPRPGGAAHRGSSLQTWTTSDRQKQPGETRDTPAEGWESWLTRTVSLSPRKETKS